MDNAKLKIVVTGANGNLGTQIISVFSKTAECVGVDSDVLDITNEQAVMQFISEHRPQLVINCAAYNAVDLCEQEQYKVVADAVNGYAVGFLAKACAQVGAAFVHYTSDYVFDGSKKEGYTENEIPQPISAYGASKRLGETELQRVAKDLGLKYWYIIRTSKLFGPQGSANAKKSFFDIMKQLSTTQEVVKVVDEEVSCFTYTVDLAQATHELVHADAEAGIYHLVNEGPATWYQAAKEYFALAGITTPTQAIAASDMPRPAKRPAYSVLLNTKRPHLPPYTDALQRYIASTR